MVSGLRPWSLVTWSPWLLDHWVYRVIGLGSLHGYGLYWVMGSGLSMAMVSIGSWARVKPLTQGRAQGQITSPWSEPSQQPRVKPTDQGLGSSPGSSPQTRAKPNYPGYGSGSWVKPLTHGRAQTPRVKTRVMGQAQAPGSKVRGLGSRVSMVSDPAPFTMRAHLGFWLWR
jgi:hypothetical protein